MELFSRAIQGNESQLVRRIQVIGLWRELLSRKVLTAEQLQLCQSEVFCSIIFALWKRLVIMSIYLQYGYLPIITPSYLSLACSL